MEHKECTIPDNIYTPLESSHPVTAEPSPVEE